METQETHTSKKERKGLRKVWDRVKAIFKPKTATTATTSTSAIPASTSQGQPSVRQKPEPQPESKLEGTAQPPRIEVDDTAEESPVALEPTKQPPAKAPISVTHDPQDEAQMRFSKAQAIFAKYNLELSPADWDMRPKQPYERVSKNIRMRVRYTCHSCSTTFGRDRVCATCHHRRCAQCSRYPPKRIGPRQRPTGSNVPQDSTEAPPGVALAAHRELQADVELPPHVRSTREHYPPDRGLQEALIAVVEQPPNQAGQPRTGDGRAVSTG
ncbi:hypothetical protein ABEF93_003519 [Exophiala dermatitidis]